MEYDHQKGVEMVCQGIILREHDTGDVFILHCYFYAYKEGEGVLVLMISSTY